jgi:triacylglycerol lipase
MSFLVELPEHQYQPDACNDFRPQHEFCLGTAKAMIWLAQLANECDCKKIERILRPWGLCCRRILSSQIAGVASVKTKLGIVVSGHNATVVAFADTDFLSLGHWLTGMRCRLSGLNIDEGLNRAVDGIWDLLRSEVSQGLQDKRLLFMTGHSSGGALSIIAGDRAHRELNADIAAIYTFGSTRPGGKEFAERYCLASSTYRFVYGNDLAASFPPRKIGYRHVGKMIHCPAGKRFEDASFPLSDEDTRDFFPMLIVGLKEWLRAGLRPSSTYTSRTDLLGQLFRFLPTPIGDHVPDRYIHALSGVR